MHKMIFIKTLKNSARKLLFNFKITEIEILIKHACQNMAAMET